MSEMKLVEAVKAGARASFRELIESGAEIDQQDEQGWTPLNWAAARGDSEMIELLLQHGADPFKVGRDLRTPEMIALAAGHAEAVKLLRRTVAEIKGEEPGGPERKYCRAYRLGELRRFSAWTENKINGAEESDGRSGNQTLGGHALSDGAIVFLHQDYKVTRSIWPDEDVIFDQVTEQWKDYCATSIGFVAPDSLDLIVQPNGASKNAA